VQRIDAGQRHRSRESGAPYGFTCSASVLACAALHAWHSSAPVVSDTKCGSSALQSAHAALLGSCVISSTRSCSPSTAAPAHRHRAARSTAPTARGQTAAAASTRQRSPSCRRRRVVVAAGGEPQHGELARADDSLRVDDDLLEDVVDVLRVLGRRHHVDRLRPEQVRAKHDRQIGRRHLVDLLKVGDVAAQPHQHAQQIEVVARQRVAQRAVLRHLVAAARLGDANELVVVVKLHQRLGHLAQPELEHAAHHVGIGRLGDVGRLERVVERLVLVDLGQRAREAEQTLGLQHGVVLQKREALDHNQRHGDASGRSAGPTPAAPRGRCQTLSAPCP
jgi:hypothetical protein